MLALALRSLKGGIGVSLVMVLHAENSASLKEKLDQRATGLAATS
jgi:hypothetical protein